MSQERPEPAPEGIPPELVEEVHLGGTPEGRAVSAALIALSRTARSFLLYDPRNDAIRVFLEDLRKKVAAALQMAGPLALEVRPFEIVRGGEVVYLERERERSLAFRLFRDGVRRVRIEPAVPWTEVLRLLEILSIRYTGVRQNEDDVVTLLAKAGFEQISFEAVEGFVPEDEGETGTAAQAARRPGPHVEAPADWDLPPRAWPEPVPFARGEVSDEDRARLLAEEGPQTTAASAVRVVARMLSAVADPTDPTRLDDVLPFVTEVRDFLLADSQLPLLAALMRAIAGVSDVDPSRVGSVRAAFADKDVVGRLLRTGPAETEGVPDDLLEVFDLLPTDHVATLVALFGEEPDERLRSRTRLLIERYAPAKPLALLDRLRTADPPLARDLLRICAQALPERAVSAAVELAFSPDEGVVMEVIRILASAPKDPLVGRTLVKLLESDSGDVRLKVAETLAGRKEHAAFGPLVRYVERRALHSLTPQEAESYGRGLVRLSPGAALSLFKAWLHEKSLLERLLPRPHERLLRWAAVAGLGELPGDEAEALLLRVAAKADGDLLEYCEAILERREKGAKGGG